MPSLQFVSGARDQAVEPLVEGAALTIGSGPDAHIKLNDPGIEAAHCQVYPAEGAYWLRDLGSGQTIFKFKRLANNAAGLAPGDVFMIGSTFVKFWQDGPPSAGAAPAAAADSGELDAARQEAEAARARVGELEGKVTQLEQELEAAKSEGGGKLAELEERASAAEAKLAETEARASEAEGKIADAEARASEAEGKVADAEAKVAEAQQEAEEKVAAEKVAAAAKIAEAETAADAKVAAAEEQVAARVAEAEEALQATRAAFEALQAKLGEAPADDDGEAPPSDDLASALEALTVPDAVRERLGGAAAERATALAESAIRRRYAQVDTARKLGLAALDPKALEQLLEAARG